MDLYLIRSPKTDSVTIKFFFDFIFEDMKSEMKWGKERLNEVK
jgi:hypothetical protein